MATTDLGFTRLYTPAQSDRLAELLRTAGASVSLHWQKSDHSIGREELALARAWLQEA